MAAEMPLTLPSAGQDASEACERFSSKAAKQAAARARARARKNAAEAFARAAVAAAVGSGGGGTCVLSTLSSSCADLLADWVVVDSLDCCA